MDEFFNKGEQLTPVNNDITVVFNPPKDIISYEYKIYKNDKIDLERKIDKPKKTTIILTETGSYKIEIITKDKKNKENKITSGIYNIDKEKPILIVGSDSIKMTQGEILDIMGGVSAKDNFSGDLTSKITTNASELDFNSLGVKKLTYTVLDEAGNSISKTVTINVLEDNIGLYIFQGIIIFILLIIVLILLIYNKSLNLEKRIKNYSIEPIKDKSLSLFDKFYSKFKEAVKVINKIVEKSTILTKYSKRYNKYILVVNDTNRSGIDFVSSKILVAISFLFVAVFSKTVQLQILNLYEIIIPLFFGFVLPDLLYAYKYRLHRNKIENDLLQAIIIMNNAFKSGKSITQAIDLVTTELDGVISEEFKRMRMEIQFGLGIDVVFNRFSERIDLEEVTYLTASLSVLNKTGGNIIAVFSSIEKSLFNKKKLKLELASLTGSSKLIVTILIIVPILFILFISLISPTYFIPMLTTPLGIIITSFIIIYYIIYIIVVRKVMKVRM